MTNDNSSILSFLADKQRFTNGTEDIATEVLGYILSKSAAARNALSATLRVGGANVGQLTSVNTQVTGNEGARPDLVGCDEEGSERVLIEAKFWAGLTDNQPNTYLNRLPNDGKPAVLLFVAPEARLETLWPEVLRKQQVGRLGIDVETADIKSAILDGSERRMLLTSWRRLLCRMSSGARVDGDSAAERDILQLNALCEREDSEAFLPLRSEEFGPGFPRRMINLKKLIDDSTQRGRVANFVNTTNLGVQSQWYGYGGYMRIGNSKFRKQVDRYAVAWFGVHYYLWANHRETPLWLVFEDTGTISTDEVRQRTGMMVDNLDSIPIYLPTGVEYDAVLDAVVERLREIATLLATP